MFNPCIVIPIYNHGATIADMLARLETFSLPCIIVDDGSDAETRLILQSVKQRYDWLELITLPLNQGKGVAVLCGISAAKKGGYTHALQIDADGQHDINDIPVLLDSAKKYPEALVSGLPKYDESVPKSRLYGRYITHFWVWVETLSFGVKDSMCGFRVYPVGAVMALSASFAIGRRMTFDTDIMVKMVWSGVAVIFISTRVIYPQTGISHFALVKDNLRICVMHTQLVFGMLLRLPVLLMRKVLDARFKKLCQQSLQSNCAPNESGLEPVSAQSITPTLPVTKQQNAHWSEQRESGSYSGLAFSVWCYSFFGRAVMNLLLYPIIAYFFLSNGKARGYSRQFLQRVYRCAQFDSNSFFKSQPRWRDSFRHLLSFGHAIVDRLAVLSGEFKRENLKFKERAAFIALAKSGTGAVILTSHLGSTEMLRAIASQVPEVKLNILAFTDHLLHFEKLLKNLDSKTNVELIQISAINPGTAMMLQQRIEQGEFLIITCDRSPPSTRDRVSRVDFLGDKAPFPQGAFILASLLKCPVHLLFCLKEHNTQTVYFEKFADRIDLPRKEREQKLHETIQRYAARLGYYCVKAPLQWFNFYDFWG